LTFQIVPLHNSFFGGKFSIWNLKSDYDLQCIYIDTISFISSNYLFFLSVFVINILLLSSSFPYLHFLFVQESTVVKKKKQEEVNKEKEVYRWLQNKLLISQTIIIIRSIYFHFVLCHLNHL
jgi:hypothetical protein